MIRAKLERVNGTEFSQLTTDRFFETREKEREERFRNRGMNLSYRSSLSNSESLIAGKDFQGHFDAEKQSLPEVSLEYRFADRLNLNLGDILEFDVQGVSVKGVVNSLRKVKWTSFQPNFFIQFPTGVLEGAPKTFIATLPTLEESMKNKLQAQVVDAFPNISLIDVSRLVERILTIVDKMSGALKLMLILTLITGFVVVFSVSQSQVQSRQQEMILMKMLGVDYRSQWHSYCLEVVILSFCAATVGFILNYILIAVVSHYFFNTIFLPDLSFGFGLLVGVPILVLMVLGVTLRQLFRRPTAEWL